jgi:hypothetical protein
MVMAVVVAPALVPAVVVPVMVVMVVGRGDRRPRRDRDGRGQNPESRCTDERTAVHVSHPPQGVGPPDRRCSWILIA